MKHPPLRDRTRFGLPVILVLLLAIQARADQQPEAAWEPVWDHWYVLEIDDAPAGWLREQVLTDGRYYETRQEQQLAVSRGAERISIGGRNVFRETVDGRPVVLSFVVDLGRQPVETTWKFHDDHVESITAQGGRRLSSRLELPAEPWLTPMSVHRHVLERLRSGAEEISYRTIEPDNGLEPVLTRHVLQGRDHFQVDGEALPVTVWQTSTTALPGLTARSLLSSDGHLLHDEVVMPIGRLVSRVASAGEALAAVGGAAPELMLQTFVEPDRPIKEPRKTRRSRLRLRVRGGEMPALPAAGAQRVEPGSDPATVLLVVDLDDPLPASLAERENAAYREPSAMIDSSDALVQKIAARACGGIDGGSMEQAEAMRRFVHRHISSKDLDTAFASASETAKMRTGDCSEHGVLLCAMLRAQGIPARVATGLVYAESFAGERDIFGWHMWTQALIDGHWMDLDATLDLPYDAVHVLVGTSSLADGVPSTELATMLSLLGNLEIEVLEVE